MSVNAQAHMNGDCWPSQCTICAAVNRCDHCSRQIPDDGGALCNGCADAQWDEWLDRHDDIGVDE